MAPTGRPPPSALAAVSTSGRTGSCSYAHRVPVLPIPHWTSSKTSAAPTASHASRAATRTSSAIGKMPASPWIGSIITAAVRSLTAARRAAGSSRGTETKPRGRGPKRSSRASRGVAASAPSVRPWKAPSSVTISGASIPRAWARLRTSLIAPSLASAPELHRNTRPPRLDSASRSLSRIAGPV